MRANEFLNINLQEGDNFDIELGDDFCISTVIAECSEDSIVLIADSKMMDLLSKHKLLGESSNNPSANDSTSPIHGNDKYDTDSHEPNVDSERSRRTGEDYDDKRDLEEAEYQGRKVQLGKPMKGDVKKSKVYVKGPKGNVVKVNFGDPNMKIKKSNPKRRKSFRARHNCANPGPRWKARYWSCRAW